MYLLAIMQPNSVSVNKGDSKNDHQINILYNVSILQHYVANSHNYSLDRHMKEVLINVLCKT